MSGRLCTVHLFLRQGLCFSCVWKMLRGYFDLPYKHHDHKEKVNYLIEMKENESRKS